MVTLRSLQRVWEDQSLVAAPRASLDMGDSKFLPQFPHLQSNGQKAHPTLSSLSFEHHFSIPQEKGKGQECSPQPVLHDA